MVTHFSTIGFPVSSPDDFHLLAKSVAEIGQIRNCPGGCYIQWRGASGVELWVQLDESGRFLDIQPHFSGMAAMRVGVTKRLSRPTDTPLDGAWQAWADPIEDENPADGLFELTFEAPDFALQLDLQLPLLATAQLAAFAHEVTFFEDEAAFRAAPQVNGRLEAQSFTPAPKRVREGGETEPQTAEALICGHVMRVEMLTNELTGLSFYWLLVETAGGRVDLVIDPQLVPVELTAGGIVMAFCWLSGQLL
ncbi:MAG: hypothetical protein V4719_26985 [Planctomycetota bacterium]